MESAMKKPALLALAALTIFSMSAKADDEIKWSGAVKVWDATLKLHDKPDGTVQGTSSSNSAGNLSITGKKNDYFATFSMLLPASYDYGTSGYLNRRDYDVALGWHFSDSLSALLGSKTINFHTNNAGSDGTIRSTYVGLSAAKPINQEMFGYGTLTYSLRASNSTDDPRYNDKNKQISYEIGAGYLVNNKTQLTLGYRVQNLSNRYVPTGATETDIVRGVIFGTNVSFN